MWSVPECDTSVGAHDRVLLCKPCARVFAGIAWSRGHGGTCLTCRTEAIPPEPAPCQHENYDEYFDRCPDCGFGPDDPDSPEFVGRLRELSELRDMAHAEGDDRKWLACILDMQAVIDADKERRRNRPTAP